MGQHMSWTRASAAVGTLLATILAPGCRDPIPPPSLTVTRVSLAAGRWHTCGLTSTGAAYCWGDNQEGQLGSGSTTGSSTPVAVAGGLTFRTLVAGPVHTCGLTSFGAAYCWGGDFGSTPVAVSGDLSFSAIAAGGYYAPSVPDGYRPHTCGLTNAGTAYCWG